MFQDYNQKLIDVLSEYIPQKGEHVSFLMNTINLGKEAAYRRLRNEVTFTFNEAALIAKKIGISLDSIITKSISEEIPTFQFFPSLYGFNKDYKCYYDFYSSEQENTFNELMKDSSVEIISAFETMPHAVLFAFKHISRFRAFKWHYQINEKTEPVTFSSIQLPAEVNKRHEETANTINNFPKSKLILSRNVFSRLINEINYFRNLYLIDNDETSLLKEDLMKIVDVIEERAVTGKTSLGKEVMIYLSNIDFDMDSTYIKGTKQAQAIIHIYQMNALASSDARICEMQLSWIESLRKYSTLITRSGDRERIEFFKKQREMVNSML